MRIVCAWCKAVMADGDEPESHGICGRCFVLELEYRQLTPEEHAWCLAQPDEHANIMIRNHELPTVILHVHWCQDRTFVGAGAYAYAFDCRLDADQIAHHYRKVILCM